MEVIMKCPAIKKLGCTMLEVFAAIREDKDLEICEGPGLEGIRRSTPPPLLEEAPGTPGAQHATGRCFTEERIGAQTEAPQSAAAQTVAPQSAAAQTEAPQSAAAQTEAPQSAAAQTD